MGCSNISVSEIKNGNKYCVFKNEAKKLIEVLEKKYNERLLADIKKVALSKSDYKETVEVEKHLILGKN